MELIHPSLIQIWKNTSIVARDTGFGRGNQANKGSRGLQDSWGLITATWMHYLWDFQGIGIARSIGQTSNANSGSIMAKGDIDNLAMEKYLALNRGNQAPGVVKPEIASNVNFKIKSQFMRELQEDTFSGNKNDDAHEHVERVLDIVTLFNIPGVTHDAVMLRIFPITLTEAAKRLVDRLSSGTVDSRDFLKKDFIQRLWLITLKSGTEIRNINSSSNTEGIAAIVSKLESLSRDMKKLKENVHAIQVGCQTCGGVHLDKECPLNEEVQSMEEVKYGAFGRSPLSTEEMGLNIMRVHSDTIHVSIIARLLERKGLV
ncbi:hypothetical protein Tco_0077206 [Tanacetum coccineum]